jgi:hypothetical protein
LAASAIRSADTAGWAQGIELRGRTRQMPQFSRRFSADAFQEDADAVVNAFNAPASLCSIA